MPIALTLIPAALIVGFIIGYVCAWMDQPK